MTVKVSVSLPEDDIAFLERVSSNRSAAIHTVIALARRAELADAYQDAYSDTADDADRALWGTTVGDGLE